MAPFEAGNREHTSHGMSVAFRVDAGEGIGTGHLIRCLTLADALAVHGASSRFISDLADDLRTLVRSRGHEFVTLHDAPAASRPRPVEDADAAETARRLDGRRWNWIVVDNYALGATWESSMRGAGRSILAIDDLADRVHACDVLLDQNYLPAGERRYAGKVPAECELLVGPRYALLRPEYREQRERVRCNSAPAKVFVFFGGADPFNLNRLALEALSDNRLEHLEIDVVCGTASAATELQRVSNRDRVRVHGPRPHLADLMAAADIAIGAGGSTTWERLCLGLRSLVVTVADNQSEVARWLEHEGLIRLVGDAEAVTAGALRDAMIEEIAAPRTTVLREGMRLCDGQGVLRVVDVMRTPR